MKSLLFQKVEYAKERLREIEKDKLEEVREFVTTEGRTLTELEKLQLIVDGGLLLRPGAKLSWSLSKAYDFSEYSQESQFDDKSYEKISKLIRQHASKIRDHRFILGKLMRFRRCWILLKNKIFSPSRLPKRKPNEVGLSRGECC